jgi:hypothetical protein
MLATFYRDNTFHSNIRGEKGCEDLHNWIREDEDEPSCANASTQGAIKALYFCTASALPRACPSQIYSTFLHIPSYLIYSPIYLDTMLGEVEVGNRVIKCTDTKVRESQRQRSVYLLILCAAPSRPRSFLLLTLSVAKMTTRAIQLATLLNESSPEELERSQVSQYRGSVTHTETSSNFRRLFRVISIACGRKLSYGFSSRLSQSLRRRYRPHQRIVKYTFEITSRRFIFLHSRSLHSL